MSSRPSRSSGRTSVVPLPSSSTGRSSACRPVGDHTFAVLEAQDVDATLVSDDEIVTAQRVLWDRLRMVAEPGGATAFAALLAGRLELGPGPVAVVISGANTTAVQL